MNVECRCGTGRYCHKHLRYCCPSNKGLVVSEHPGKGRPIKKTRKSKGRGSR